jgi:basic membrane lipoprotein Med (substrate-binding protein (PBP1-ABC) superfamily)
MMAGFSAGAKTVSDTIRVYTQYVLSYNSPSRAQQLIADLVEKGVDVIFADCGASIIGIEGTAKAENVKVICSDSYRYESSRTVAYLSIDIRPIVREMLGMYLDGALRKGGEYSFGLDNKVFSYDMSASKQETKDEVDIFKVIFFEFGTDLPRTQEELESFDYEYLRGVILEGVDGSVDTKEPSTEAAGSEN